MTGVRSGCEVPLASDRAKAFRHFIDAAPTLRHPPYALRSIGQIEEAAVKPPWLKIVAQRLRERTPGRLSEHHIVATFASVVRCQSPHADEKFPHSITCRKD